MIYSTTDNLANRGNGEKRLSVSSALDGQLMMEDPLLESFGKVERAKQEWEATVDALPELIFVVDDHGRIIRANRTIEDWGMGSVKDVMGLNLHALIHPVCAKPCYLERFLSLFQQTDGDGGNAITANVANVETYDTLLQRDIQMRGRPVHFKNDTAVNHWVVILHDISERKRMEQALQRQNGRLSAINAINQTILTARSPEEIAQATLANLQSLIPFQQAHILLRIPQKRELLVLAVVDDGNGRVLEPGQVLPRTDFTGQNDNSLEHFFMVQRLSALTVSSPIEERWRQQNIQSYINFPLIMGVNLIGSLQLATNSQPAFAPGHIAIVREIAQSLTIAINQSQLTRKLEQGNQELQELLRAKHEMMQNVSHDLRSPLALIKGYTELLQEGLFGSLTDEQQEALTVLDINGDQLFFLIDRLFKLQTIDKHTLEKTTFNLYAFLKQVEKSWQVLATNKSVHLDLDAPPELPELTADANMLNQTLFNLLDNALKYSPQGSAVTLGAVVEDDCVILSVADEGAGIPPDKLARLFDRFYQVEKGSVQAQKGAGIGLALCKAITEAHDGRIWAESAGAGAGSVFFVKLPLNPII